MPELRLRTWQGSLASRIEPTEAQPGDFVVLENFLYDRFGLPVVRGGRSHWNAAQITESGSPVPITGLAFYSQSAQPGRAREAVLALAGTKVLRFDAEGVPTTLFSGFESGVIPSWAFLRQWALLATDSEEIRRPLVWDGASETMRDIPGAPSCSLVASHANRLWAVGEDGSTLFYSAPFDPLHWDAAHGGGQIPVGLGDGNSINALVPGIPGRMLVAKDGARGGATYFLEGLSALDFHVVDFSSTLGIVSSRAANLIGDKDTLFASRRGLHSLARVFKYGDLDSTDLDVAYSDIWELLPDTQKRGAVAVDDYPRRQWWIFYDADADGINDHALVVNYGTVDSRGLYKASVVTFGVQSACVARDPQMGTYELLTGGSDGWIRRENVLGPLDDGSPFIWRARLVGIDGGDELAAKSWTEIWLRHQGWGEVDCTCRWWPDEQQPRSQTIPLLPPGVITPQDGLPLGEFRGVNRTRELRTRIRLLVAGVRLNLEFSGTGSSTKLLGFVLLYERMPERADVDSWFPYIRTQVPG